MKIRKIAVMVVMALGMCLVLSGCGEKVEFTKDERNEIIRLKETQAEIEKRVEELEAQLNLTEGETKEADEDTSNGSTTSAPEEKQQEEEKKMTAAITENDRGGRQVDVKVFEDFETAVSKVSAGLNKAGNITVSLFNATVSKVTVTSNTSNYVNYAEVKYTSIPEVDNGYYTFNYDYPEKTRVIFRIVTTTGNEYFISVKD